LLAGYVSNVNSMDYTMSVVLTVVLVGLCLR
jgi:hypothetical protein